MKRTKMHIWSHTPKKVHLKKTQKAQETGRNNVKMATAIVVVQLLSHVRLFVTPRTAACQTSLSFTTYRSLLKLMSIESVMPSNHLELCHPLLSLPSIFPSIRVFSNKLALLIRWPKYWSFSFSISPSNEYSGLISFRIYWFDLLAVQKTLRTATVMAWLSLHFPKSLWETWWDKICCP